MDIEERIATARKAGKNRTVRKAQENSLWNIEMMLKDGCRDDGTPFTEDEASYWLSEKNIMERVLA